MKVIITHESADFDALASAFAAQKLYPDAAVVLGRALSRPVREFLSIHKDRFRHLQLQDIDPDRVSLAVIVDVRRASRLPGFDTLARRARSGDPGLEVHIYDHHAAAKDDLHGSVERVEHVGCTTTLLVELIRARKVDIDPVEATLFALGIHTDTGSLCYSTTTARDAVALAWLLEKGTNLSALWRYLYPPLTRDQREAFQRIFEELRLESFHGAEVGFAVIEGARRCEGLDVVASRVAEVEALPALFVLYATGDRRLDVIARARSGYLNVGRIVSAVGGGGHEAAAAASVKGLSVTEVLDRLRSALRQIQPAFPRVADVMSAPVHSVSPELPLAELEATLAEWAHTGAPVMRGQELVGIVSRRDVLRARKKGRAELPVSSYMSQKVETVAPEAPLEQAIARMERADVGRLVVLAEGRVVGIITRSDALRVLYGPQAAPSSPRSR